MSTVQGPSEVDPKDPWATVKTGYDPKKFYTRATDGHGHGETIYIKLSPGMAATARDAIGKIPEYRSINDVIRDAVAHRMHEVSSWPEDHVNLQPLKDELLANRIATMKADRARWQANITDLEAQVRALVDEGDLESAEFLLQEAADIDTMTPPYQILMGNLIQKLLRFMDREPPVTTLND